MSKSRVAAPEFSHPLPIDKIPAAGMVVALNAREKECQALAERFGLAELNSLQAELTVHAPRHDGMINVTGNLTAKVVQTCVVTLEPLPAKIDRNIDTQFVPSAMVDNDNENMEALDGNIIDLGELAAQHLAMALDPYPRKPGLPLVDIEFGATVGKSANPFAKLLKPKDGEK